MELRKIEEKLAHLDQASIVEDPGPSLRRHEQKITAVLEEIERLVLRSGLQAHGNSTFPTRLAAAGRAD